MIKNWFKTSWRNIRKHTGFSLINAGGLTLGIASCLLLMLYVAYQLNFDHQFKNLDNIYLVENNQFGDGKIYTYPSTPGQTSGAIKNEEPGVIQTARVVKYGADGLISYNNNSFKKAGIFADAGFFSIFSYHFIMGNSASALAQPNSIVITMELAKTLFGNQDPMNKIITRNNQSPMMVSGVIDNIPANESYQFDFVMPWVLFENANPWAKNSDFFCQTFVELKDPSYLTKANQMLSSMAAKHANGYKNQLFLFPFSKFHLYDKFDNGKAGRRYYRPGAFVRNTGFVYL